HSTDSHTIHPLPLHDALPISEREKAVQVREIPELLPVGCRLGADGKPLADLCDHDADLARRNLHPGELLDPVQEAELPSQARHQDRKSTRLNSSHVSISYAVF